MDLIERFKITKLDKGEFIEVEDSVIREFPLRIHVNGDELVTLVCTPEYMDELVVGYLFSEGLVMDTDAVSSIKLEEESIYVNLQDEIYIKDELKHRVITSGCGKSTIYTDLTGSGLKKVRAKLEIEHNDIFKLIKNLYSQSRLFKATGGVHNSLLAAADGDLEIFREDIGRHNTVDKIIGHMILNRVHPGDKILLISGRISAEILLKTARMKIPILISPSAPTDLAVRLAYRLGVTLVGFARGKRMNIYTHTERII